MISRSYGIATARAWSKECSTSNCSMMLPFTAAAPRLFTDETCAPAMLTNAEVISRPEVDSAFSTERVIACEAAARSTIMPLRMPSEGSMPTPRMRMDLLSSTRPTSVHTLVVPTSMPTTISSIIPFCYFGISQLAGDGSALADSILLTHPVIWRGREGDIDQRRADASLRQRIHQRLIHTHLQLNIVRGRAKINTPAARVIPAEAHARIV